jgi:hypothetical protein
VLEDRLASACLLLDEQSFSSGAGDAAAESSCGDAIFDWLADKLARRGRKGERASERRETDTALAEKMVREALVKERWREIDLATQPKRHPVKVKIAQQLRRQTPMSRQWIADRLRMGSASYVSNLLNSVDSKL